MEGGGGEKERQKVVLGSWSVWWGEERISSLGEKILKKMRRRKLLKTHLADFNTSSEGPPQYVVGWADQVTGMVLHSPYKSPPRQGEGWGLVWLILQMRKPSLSSECYSKSCKERTVCWDLNWRSSTLGLKLVIVSALQPLDGFPRSSTCLLVNQINACLLQSSH